ncbi:MAG TPA: glycosyltransferase [Candidatus Babeliaceae bacterium]|nr:glycosyltransferase [Candidatus Babeliaceae bacterium]
MKSYIKLFFMAATIGIKATDTTEKKRFNLPYVNFYSSMNQHKLNHPLPPIGHINNMRWRMLKALYEKNFSLLYQSQTLPKIPKVIHQIWLGSPFPEKYKRYQESWLRNHPDWQYKLWTDEDVKKMKLYNQAAYNNAPNYGEKADILRYEILYHHGGLYVDTDFEAIRSFDVLNNSYDFYVGISRVNPVRVSNALIASKPGHPIFKHCMKIIKRNQQQKLFETQTVERTGPEVLTQAFLSYIASDTTSIIALPISFFYPLPIGHLAREASYWVKPETFAIHYWATSWVYGA